jgi:NhaA family Na+:H+ antiporter
VWVTVKLGLAKLPYRTSWLAIYGVALLCGVGFTMSLFIGTLAFNGVGGMHGTLLRAGVLLGSFLSGILGFLVLYRAYSKDHHERHHV